MRSGWTTSPSARSRASRSAPEARPKSAGSACHSACQSPAGRSWATAIADEKRRDEAAGAAAWAARMIVAATGLLLCGMAEEPPRPGTFGSATSPTSVVARCATSVAILASAPISAASKEARRRHPAAAGVPGEGRRAEAEVLARRRRATAGPCEPRPASVPTGPPREATSTRSRSGPSSAAASAMPESQTAALNPKVTGAACWP